MTFPKPHRLDPMRPLRLMGPGLPRPNHLRIAGARRLGRLIAQLLDADPANPWILPELRPDRRDWKLQAVEEGMHPESLRRALSPAQRQVAEQLSLRLLICPLGRRAARPVPEVWERQVTGTLHPDDAPPRGWSAWDGLLIPGPDAPQGMPGPAEEPPLRLQSRALDEGLRLLTLPEPHRVGKAAQLRETLIQALTQALQTGGTLAEPLPGVDELDAFLTRAWTLYPHGARIGPEEWARLNGQGETPCQARRSDLRQGLAAPPEPWTTDDPRSTRPWPSSGAGDLHHTQRMNLSSEPAPTEHPTDQPLRLALIAAAHPAESAMVDLLDSVLSSEYDDIPGADDFSSLSVERTGQGAPSARSGRSALLKLRGEPLPWPLDVTSLRSPEGGLAWPAWSDQPLRGSFSHMLDVGLSLSETPGNRLNTVPFTYGQLPAVMTTLHWTLCRRFGRPDPAALIPWTDGPMPGGGHDLRRLPPMARDGQRLLYITNVEEDGTEETSAYWSTVIEATPPHLGLLGMNSRTFLTWSAALSTEGTLNPRASTRSWLSEGLRWSPELGGDAGLIRKLSALLDELDSGGLLISAGHSTWVAAWATLPGSYRGQRTPVQRLIVNQTRPPQSPSEVDPRPLPKLYVLTRPKKERP